MGTIVVILYRFQDETFPKRWVMDITLNTYISILSRAASAALMLPVSEALGQLKWSRFQGRSNKVSESERFDRASLSEFQAGDEASRGVASPSP